jgi:lipopolysaccharide export LptBFGC system permease protein LptF
MKIHLLPYLLFALLSFATSESINAYGNGKQQQVKLAANYSKRIMTGGMFVPGRDSASNTIRRAIVDTSKNNRIIGIREGSSGVYQLELDIADNQQNLSIGIFNLLGKKVIDVHQGGEFAGRSKMFDINVQGIPNGIYMCIVQGDNFRLAEKFYVSR